MICKVKYIFVLLMLLFLLAVSVSSQVIDDVKKTELSNGLTVLTLENNAAPLVGIQIFYRIGLQNEPRGYSGINQICARMISSGTEHCQKEDYARLISSAGGSFKYMVWEDFVNLSISAPSAMLDTVLSLEADRMQNYQVSFEKLSLAKDDIKKSRSNILRTDMYALLNEEIMGLSYRVHTYKNPLYGRESEIKNLTIKEIKKYMSLYFQPSNAVLVIVGDFNSAKTIKRLEGLFGNIFSTSVKPPRDLIEPQQLGERLSFIHGDVGVPVFISSFHIPSIVHDDFLPLTLTSNILTVGQSSRLSRRLVIEDSEAMAVGGGLMKSKDPGIMFLWSVLNYESDISDAIAILDDELLEIAQNGITESELERAKNRVEFDYYQSLSTFLQKSFMLGYYYTTTGNWECLNNYIKKAREVTADDVKRVAAEYLRKSNSNTVILQPYDESEDDSNID